MKTAVFELQKALYTRLTNGAAKIPENVHSHVPDESAYPYIIVLPPEAIADHMGKATNCEEIKIVFQIWDSQGIQATTNENIARMSTSILESLTLSTDDPGDQNFLTLDNHIVVRQDYQGLVYNVETVDSLRNNEMTMTFLVQEA